MQLTLSLNRRTHLFIRDGKLFFKLYKQNKFSDKKDFAVLTDVSIEQAEQIHQWLGEVIAECKQNPAVNSAKSVDEYLAQIKQLLVSARHD